MPVPSISRVPFAGRPCSRMGDPGDPTLRTSAMRFCCTTTSIGPRAGAPVPSITLIPRITSLSNGPSPSPDRRSGDGLTLTLSCATTDAAKAIDSRHVSFMGVSIARYHQRHSTFLHRDGEDVMSRIGRATILAFVAATHLLGQGRQVTPADQAAGQAWWAHIQALADDSMQGRLTGSEDYLRAAKYVVSQFDSAGLKPAGVNGYYQPVKFDVTRVLADKSSVTLLAGDRKEPLVLGRDTILGSRGTQPKSITAPLVFVGYGLHLPEAKYDDFDSPELPFASLQGKIVVYINGGPGDLPGALKSFARTAPLEKALADAGALGAIAIPTPKSMDVPWQRIAANASQPGMRLAADPK